MIYLLAIIGLLALTYLAWRAFGPDAPAVPGQNHDRVTGRQTRRGPVGPDDDPEFLSGLDRDAQNNDPKFKADGDDKPSTTE
jgi:hypothetical protein